MNRKKWILVCLVVVFGLLVIFASSCASPTPLYESAKKNTSPYTASVVSCIEVGEYDINEVRGWNIVRCTDRELGNICYLYGESISCVKGE